MNSQQLVRKKISEALSTSCLICGGRPYVAGIFLPDCSEDFGGVPGKQRCIFYSLCKRCFEEGPDREAIEKILFFHLGG